jgi:hypothetical protein
MIDCGNHDPFSCRCDCHTTGAVHIINCCYSCSNCGKNRITDIEAHREACKLKCAQCGSTENVHTYTPGCVWYFHYCDNCKDEVKKYNATPGVKKLEHVAILCRGCEEKKA